MKRFALALAIIAVVALLTVTACAEDDIYVRGKKKVKGAIKEETAGGVVVQGAKKPIPAEEIIDIEYELLPFGVRTGKYRPARNLEQESNDPAKEAKRQVNLAKALEGYQDSLKELQKGQKYPERHLEYKIGVLLARQAHEDGAPAEPAISRLKDFKSKHADSWQIAGCLKLLAQLQVEQKQFADAEETYKELSEANVPIETKQEAELLAAQVTLRTGKHELAQKKLQTLIDKLPIDSRFVVRARIAQAECLVAANKSDDGRKILRDIIKDATDPAFKAAAHNVLGESYFKAGLHKEARWEFLWVDIIYNQDRAEHARALYFLMDIFERLGDAERAQECRETLNDRQFAGLEHQRLAREKKMP